MIETKHTLPPRPHEEKNVDYRDRKRTLWFQNLRNLLETKAITQQEGLHILQQYNLQGYWFIIERFSKQSSSANIEQVHELIGDLVKRDLRIPFEASTSESPHILFERLAHTVKIAPKEYQAILAKLHTRQAIPTRQTHPKKSKINFYSGIHEEEGNLITQARIDHPLLSHKQEIILFQQMETAYILGDDVLVEQLRNDLVMANLGLSAQIGSIRNINRFHDRFQDGNLGLLHAANWFAYDWRTGFKFSTFATYWIRQYTTREETDDTLIRVPEHLKESAFKVSKRIMRYCQDNHIEAQTTQQSIRFAIRRIIDSQQVDEETAMQLLAQKLSLTVTDLRKCVTYYAQFQPNSYESLNAVDKNKTDGDHERGELIADEEEGYQVSEATTFLDEVFEKVQFNVNDLPRNLLIFTLTTIKDEVEAIRIWKKVCQKHNLPPEDIQTIAQEKLVAFQKLRTKKRSPNRTAIYHGPLTLDMIGQTFKMTRERARQITEETLNSIREQIQDWQEDAE